MRHIRDETERVASSIRQLFVLGQLVYRIPGQRMDDTPSPSPENASSAGTAAPPGATPPATDAALPRTTLLGVSTHADADPLAPSPMVTRLVTHQPGDGAAQSSVQGAGTSAPPDDAAVAPTTDDAAVTPHATLPDHVRRRLISIVGEGDDSSGDRRSATWDSFDNFLDSADEVSLDTLLDPAPDILALIHEAELLLAAINPSSSEDAVLDQPVTRRDILRCQQDAAALYRDMLVRFGDVDHIACVLRTHRCFSICSHFVVALARSLLLLDGNGASAPVGHTGEETSARISELERELAATRVALSDAQDRLDSAERATRAVQRTADDRAAALATQVGTVDAAVGVLTYLPTAQGIVPDVLRFLLEDCRDRHPAGLEQLSVVVMPGFGSTLPLRRHQPLDLSPSSPGAPPTTSSSPPTQATTSSIATPAPLLLRDTPSTIAPSVATSVTGSKRAVAQNTIPDILADTPKRRRLENITEQPSPPPRKAKGKALLVHKQLQLEASLPGNLQLKIWWWLLLRTTTRMTTMPAHSRWWAVW